MRCLDDEHPGCREPHRAIVFEVTGGELQGALDHQLACDVQIEFAKDRTVRQHFRVLAIRDEAGVRRAGQTVVPILTVVEIRTHDFGEHCALPGVHVIANAVRVGVDAPED